MMDRKKKLLSLVTLFTLSAMLFACGEKSTSSVDVPENSAAEASDSQAQENVLEKTEDADNPLDVKNTMALKASDITGLSNLRKQNNDDGTYYYQDITEDGDTVITNMCYRNSQRDGQDMDAYAENIVCAQVNSDAVITGSSQDEELSTLLTYPVFKVEYEVGGNEDTRQAVGAVVLTDNFTYYYGFDCPIDFFEEHQEFYESEFKNLTFVDLDAEDLTTGENFATVYLQKVTEYNDKKTADNFAFIYANGSDIPYLVVANSEGPLDEAGNTHLLLSYDGEINELLSVSSGFDGHHIFIAADTNIVLQTSGMSGCEYYMLYTFDGKELEQTKELKAICDIDNDSYTYFDGETELTKEEYDEEFAKSISVNNPYTEIDFDEISEVNIAQKDGYVNFETISTQKYLSYDEIKEQLIEMGATAE